MIFIYGLNISGLSILEYFSRNNIQTLLWDDNHVVRNNIKKKFKSVNFIHPKKINWNMIKEAYVSPGIDLKHKFLFFKKNKSKLFRDLELYSRLINNQKIIAVTGTNGKSTTVKMISELIVNNKSKCFVGGNIGKSLIDFSLQKENPKTHVIELSSYQLESAPSFSSDISILLNISNDHIDRHKTMFNYSSLKEKILKNNKLYSIISIDDKFCQKIYKKNKSKNIIPISNSQILSKGISFVDDKIIDNYFENKIIFIKKISRSLKGSFNKQNILATYATSKILKIKTNIFYKTIENFRGLPHRFEHIYDNEKFSVINNSKATNIDSAVKTIKNLDNIYLIIGGRIKNNNFNSFKKYKKKIKICFIIGESTNLIYNQLSNFFICKKSYNLERAVKQISLSMKKMNTKINIVLAPACSSFDQFSSFEERGITFKKLVKSKLRKYVS